jgi:predicted transcriptional regulator
MTPRCSVRAAAREIYGGMTPSSLRSAGQAPDPPSLRSGATSPSSPGSSEPSLTAKARALYEGSAMPVAEIARLCGVTERTIYKYAARGNWKPRYRWRADGGRPAAFAPVKGAGGRFIRRADRGKPFATGLKATDPAGRVRALADCDAAARHARVAQAEAAQVVQHERVLRALALVARVGNGFVAYKQELKRKRIAESENDQMLGLYQLTFRRAIEELEEEMRRREELMRLGRAVGARTA